MVATAVCVQIIQIHEDIDLFYNYITSYTRDTTNERLQTFLDQRQIMQLIQQQVQSSLSYFMSQICPQMGWNSMMSPMVMG